MSTFSVRRLLRFGFLVWCDGVACLASLLLALAIRYYGEVPANGFTGFAAVAPLYVLTTLGTFVCASLYDRTWRYFSLNDLPALLRLVAISTVISFCTLLLLGLHRSLPLSIPVIYWFVASFALAALRLGRRTVRRHLQKRPHRVHRDAMSAAATQKRALLIGDIDWAESILEPFDRLHGHAYEISGILDHSGLDVHLRVHGIRVFGTVESLEETVSRLARVGRRPHALIINASDPVLRGATMVSLVSRAERLGLQVAKIPEPRMVEPEGRQFNLEFVNVTELLGRTEICPDAEIVREAIAGRKVMVTGAGGTIGSELVRQLARFNPAEIQLLDCGEYNLYAIDAEMGETFPELPRKRILCSIRQRQDLFRAFDENRPELVFHTAALKHVPLVEENPSAGVLTNVIGTQNVADAVRDFSALAMVQVSTDKAVNPVGLMGATKRLGELYCQAMDLAGATSTKSPRFITVRFGNVLGSSGSLIPLFQRQLSRGGPLTVTDPNIERFFMTVHEAVQLILHGSAHSLKAGTDRGKIFVLDMGEPIKIMDLAKRMIWLAGLQPERDIKIEIVGLRPGEKLYEELFDDSEERLPSSIRGVLRAAPNPISLRAIQSAFRQISAAAVASDEQRLRGLIFELVELSRRPFPERFPHKVLATAEARAPAMLRPQPVEAGAPAMRSQPAEAVATS